MSYMTVNNLLTDAAVSLYQEGNLSHFWALIHAKRNLKMVRPEWTDALIRKIIEENYNEVSRREHEMSGETLTSPSGRQRRVYSDE